LRDGPDMGESSARAFAAFEVFFGDGFPVEDVVAAMVNSNGRICLFCKRSFVFIKFYLFRYYSCADLLFKSLKMSRPKKSPQSLTSTICTAFAAAASDGVSCFRENKEENG
jgi:hypothetical protein